ncbi:putative F-box protein [Capsicum galapagoense]
MRRNKGTTKISSIKKEIPSDIVLKRRKKMNEITTIIKKEMPCDIVKRKKTKKITSSYTVAKDIPSDIIFQVLSKLSIKTLDRFKCVSMSWSSMIHQPEFMKAHTPCDGILIHLLPKYSILPGNNISYMMKGLFYASINYGKNNEEFTQRVRLPYCGGYKDITPIVNGLACLYTGHQGSLFNISTLELMELPSSSLRISTLELMELPSSSLRDEARSVWYALGFDAMDNVHKLLKVSTIANRLVHEFLPLESSSRSA